MRTALSPTLFFRPLLLDLALSVCVVATCFGVLLAAEWVVVGVAEGVASQLITER